ncbi:MerR family transcriptional regulator [Duganella sp. FT109W]|uniref:MerR family transcriptional regulator n=1 Tax=Duganella margarita TaxID=2692170 RepID=A0ABW9WCC3_9BURK|nr:MerR family transcriptional regulator [Duganella margarita]MYN38089.1 MerR family transcriptional regulator [Duganella margarita]
MTTLMPIGDVERHTGIPQATLRMWERRYGFPRPLRDEFGHRVYPPHQVERLLNIRRLMAQGHRAGKLLSGGGADLAALTDQQGAQERPRHVAIQLLRQYRFDEFRNLLQLRLMSLGLRRFVIDILAPLNVEVGEAWQHGWLPVRCEHAYSVQVAMLIQNALATLRTASGRPLVMLATPHGEHHALGNLMVQAILASMAAPCIQLGTELPMHEIEEGARECGADIVALSFSSFSARKHVAHTLGSLRAALPPSVEVWAGGSGVPADLPAPAGVRVFNALEPVEQAVADWRRRHGAEAPPLRQSAERSG